MVHWPGLHQNMNVQDVSIIMKDERGNLIVESAIGRMTGVNISSDYFTDTACLEFFPKDKKNQNRVALVYGRNGSGKSTIAQGFRDYGNQVASQNVTMELIDGGSPLMFSPEEKPCKIFVYDEEYISTRVKIKDDGLDAIVLFGDQIALDEQIEMVQKQIDQKQFELTTQRTECEKFTNKDDVNSPDYWINKIKRKLHEPNGWAEIGSKIKQYKHNLKVTNIEIDKIGKLAPKKPLRDLLGRREILLTQYSAAAADASSGPINETVPKINITEDIVEKTATLLKKTVNKPQLTSRETRLLQLFGIKGAANARSFISNKENTICGQCFQPISNSYRDKVLNEIKNILNQDVESFKSELEKLLIDEISVEIYDVYRDLTSFDIVRNSLDDLNKAFKLHNSAIQAKIDNPFDPMEYEFFDLLPVCVAAKQALERLEEDRINYNRIINEKSTVQKELLEIHDAIAHYDIKVMYTSLQAQRKAKQEADNLLSHIEKELQELNDKKIELDSKRKSIKIAADEINRGLQYIFFSKSRLSLELVSDQVYHLKVNGKHVPPNKVSCGERNALALCYFFTEIARDMDAKAKYSEESLLVIDDPVSSFDVENRVGIMSFLRWKLEQVLSSCATTKVLVMTHDISVLFDLEKALQEISDYCKSVSVSADYRLFHLDEKRLCNFSYTKYNEYTQLLKKIYLYATSSAEDGDLDLVIGNMMRRVLEAFATFSFKLGIDKVSLDKRVLELLPDKESMYYRNLMYRLVLHNESHFEMNIQGAPEISFFTFLSPNEKKRTAKDILCFMYRLNKAHILSHLPDAEPNLKTWCTNINGCLADL